ncbi:MAG: ABC transporter permease [Nevskiales bacterium]
MHSAVTLVDAAPAAVSVGRPRLAGGLSTVPVVAVLLIFFVLPMLYLVRMSLSPEKAMISPLFGTYAVAQYVRLLLDPFFYEMISNSLALGVCTVVLTLLMGYPVAYYLVGTRGWERTLISAACLLPLFVNAVSGILGWYILLLPFGVVQKLLVALDLHEGPFRGLRSFWALVGVLAYENLPFAVLILASSLQAVPREKIQAARILGASMGRVLWTILVPLTLPGIFATVVLTFSLSLSSYLVPLLISGSSIKVLPIAIFTYTSDLLDWPYAAAMALLLLLIVLLVTYALTVATNMLSRRGKWEPV